MACANATGTHKFPLLYIGKAANPCCFNNINKSTLPVVYYNQKNAWINTDIFIDWFSNLFIPSVTRHMTERGQPVKALLLLDNAPAHPDVSSLTY